MKKTNFTSILPKWSWQSGVTRWLVMAIFVILGWSGAVAQTGPNCQDINMSVGADDTARVRASEFIPNIDDAGSANVLVENRFGAIILNRSVNSGFDEIALYACRLIGETLTVTVSNSSGVCWSEWTFKQGNGKTIQSNLDTAVWCLDPLVSMDPNNFDDLRWYTNEWPYTLLPTATVACGNDLVYSPGNICKTNIRDYYKAQYEACNLQAIDWVVASDCGEGDTSKVIIREWEAYDPKTNARSVTTDTIVVFKLPQLEEGNFYAPQKDTVECFLVTENCETRSSAAEYCWKQLVGLHDEGTYLYYPVTQTSGATGNVIIRANGAGVTGTTIASATPVMYFGTMSYPIQVFEGDRVLSNDGTYITVDGNWFYENGAHGFWVDLCLRTVSTMTSSRTFDSWQEWACEDGVQVLLPASPGDTINCISLCLDEAALEASKCFAVMHSEIKDLGGSCPQVVKKHFVIKQLCYSEPLVCDSNAVNVVTDNCFTEISRTELESDTSGIVSIEEVAGSNTIEIEQWKLYIDTLAPLFVYETDGCSDVSSTDATVWSTGSHDCSAEVTVPSIKLLDNCSGVKFAKATVYLEGSDPELANYGWVNLTETEDGVWAHEGGRTFKLACGVYEVFYEYGDECHNIEDISYFRIEVVDRISPTVITDDEVRISLGGGDVWVDAETFDQGTFDNCGIRMMLARRTDWKSGCGVDLCDGTTPVAYPSGGNFGALDAAIIDALNDNDVEGYYAEMYQWLVEDNYWCDDKANFVVDGWRQDVVAYWADNCNSTDDLGNPTITANTSGSIGGGWGTKVPFCCDDACEEVVVELLAIDKDCNYSKGWVTVLVEDKTPVVEGQQFADITITCTSYNENYADLIEAAVAAGNNSETAEAEFAAVDNALGAIQTGFRGATGELVDADGNEIATTFTYATTECEDSIVTSTETVTSHDGTVSEVTIRDTFVLIRDVVNTAKVGTAFTTCGSGTHSQDIWVNLNDCGVGTITRRWRVSSGCSDAHESNPLVYEQKINIVAGCTLEKNMFTGLLDVDTLTGSLTRDVNGNLAVNSGELTYSLDDTECRQLGISSSDEVFDIQGQDNAFKVHRTWSVSDWCANESFECLQKFILIVGAESRSTGNVSGTIASNFDGGRVEQVQVAGKFASGEVITDPTANDGAFSFDVAMGSSLEIVPTKDINILNGVSVGDIIEIQAHILGKKELTDKYILVAADANNDGLINTKDVSAIRRVSLRKASSFPNNTSWRFFSEATGEETYKIESLESAMNIDFIGVKVGNTDGIEDLDLSRSAQTIEFATDVQALTAGVAQSIELTSAVKLAGYQFAIKYNPSLIDFTGISGDDITEANWNKVSEGLVLVSYDGDAQTLTLDVVANANVELSKALTITNTSDFSSVAYTANNEVAPVSLAIQSTADFALFQNAPNPVANGTAISFSLGEDSDATLTFFDVNGRVLNRIVGSYSAGLNTVNVQASDLGAVGVVYYQLETATNTATKRMVVIE